MLVAMTRPGRPGRCEAATWQAFWGEAMRASVSLAVTRIRSSITYLVHREAGEGVLSREEARGPKAGSARRPGSVWRGL
jgi:hypothetical protein